MATGDRKVDIFLKKFLPQQQITENFFDYLEKAIRENFKRVFPTPGVFAPNPAFSSILSSTAADTFSITTPLEATDGLAGNQLVLDPADAGPVPFENAAAVPYHVGLRFHRIPAETEVNVRTGVIKYTFLEEAIGELGEPTGVVNDGDETLTINVDSVCEPGVSHAGRKVVVWLKQALSQAQAFEELTVIWDGVANKIETTTALGQVFGQISVDPADYQIFLKGPTVRRGTDLRLDANVAFLGIVTGAGPGNMPTSFDETDVTNHAFTLPMLTGLFFAEHSNVDGSHTDVTVGTITTKQAVLGPQLDTQVNTGDEDSPDPPVAHTLFQSMGGSGLQGVKWRLRDSSGVTVAFIDAHGNAYFQNLTAVESVFQSHVVVEGNQSIKGSSVLGDDILTDTVTFNAVLQSLGDMLYVIDSNADGVGHAHRFFNHAPSAANEILRIKEDGILRLFGNVETPNVGLSIDLDSDQLGAGEFFQITKDGGLAVLLQVLDQGEVKLFGPRLFTDNPTLAIDLDGDNDNTGELFEITRDGGTVTLLQVLQNAALKLFGPGLITDAATLAIDLDSDNTQTAELFRLTKNGGLATLFEVWEQGNVKIFGPKIFTDNAALTVDLDANNDDTGELFQITKDGGLTTLLQLLDQGALKLFGPGILTDSAAFAIDLDSNTTGTGEIFEITKDGGLTTLFQILEQGNVKLFGSLVGTDNAGLTIDLDSDNTNVGESLTLTKHGGLVSLFKILEQGDLELFGTQLLTKGASLRIDLDSDNDQIGETFSITKHAGSVSLLQILEQGDIRFFGTNIFTDTSLLNIDLDSNNDGVGELFQVSKNGGTNLLFQIREDGSIKVFGPKVFTDNAVLTVDLDSDANQSGEKLVITKNGSTQLAEVNEFGDVKATRDQLSGSGSVYQNAATTPIAVSASLNAVYDETIFRRLLKASANNPASPVVHIAGSRTTAADGSDFVLPLGTQVSNYSGGTINFATGTVTGGGTNFTPTSFAGNASQWTKYAVGLLQDNTLIVIPSATFGASKSLAPNPVLPEGAISTLIVAVQDNGSAGIGTINAITEINFDRLPASGGGSFGDGGGGATLSPASGFNVIFSDSFDAAPGNVDSRVNSSFTNATYSLLNKIFNLKCDKSRTATTTGTSFTLSGAPSFTLKVGDVLYHNASGEFRRVASLTSQVLGTLDVAFSTNLASASVLLSQAVWSLDLVSATGDAAQKTRPRDFFPSEEILQVNVDYFDSLVASDLVPDYVDPARIVASASNSGLQTDVTFPTTDTFTAAFTRPAAPTPIANYPLKVNPSKQRLFWVFFCNPSNASVTAEANLIQYKASFYEKDPTTNGGILNSAFCFSNGSGVEVNCQAPFLASGKTRLRLGFSFVPGINPGTTAGDLEVAVDGKTLPRQIAGATLDAYYLEVNGSTDTIEFWTDLSAVSVSIEVKRRQASIDTASQNTTDIAALKNQIAPIGSIIAYNPGYFTDAVNGGFTAVGPSGNSVSAFNTYLPANWRVCDGTALNDSQSPIFNGAGRFLPQLTSQRFLRGNTTSGGQGGSTAHTPSGSVSSSSSFSGTAAARSDWFTTSTYTPSGSISGSQGIDHTHSMQGHSHDNGSLVAEIIIGGNSPFAVDNRRVGSSSWTSTHAFALNGGSAPGTQTVGTNVQGDTAGPSTGSTGSMSANTSVNFANADFNGSGINPRTQFANSGSYTPAGSVSTSSSFTGSGATIEPPYVNTVFIMRVK